MLLALYFLVVITCLRGNREKASEYWLQLEALSRETGNPLAALFAGSAFGFVLIISGQPERAVRLLAAFEVQIRQRGMKLREMGGTMLMAHNQFLEMARAQLDTITFQAAWTEGQQMTLEQALALATENNNEDSQLPQAGLRPISD
jgi:hypothetical protein